jgi:hypothetical protein
LCEEQPESVTVCQLKNDPLADNHKLVEVTGFVSHDFGDFTLFDPNCPSWPEVWLEYGGKAKSGMYCCGVTADRNRPQQMVVENIPIPLVENEQFREFDKLIQRHSDPASTGGLSTQRWSEDFLQANRSWMRGRERRAGARMGAEAGERTEDPPQR